MGLANLVRMVKTFELRQKSKAELSKELDNLRSELSTLRVAQVTGGAANRLSGIRVVRKSIAKVLTIMNTARKTEIRKFYAPKKTRAIRRKLTSHEATKKSVKLQKKL